MFATKRSLIAWQTCPCHAVKLNFHLGSSWLSHSYAALLCGRGLGARRCWAMELDPVAHFGVLSLDKQRAETVPGIHTYVRSCDHIQDPSFRMRVISPGSDVSLAHILENPSSRGCIIACFDSLAQNGLSVPTCSTGTHRAGGIAEVVADWASRLLGPTMLKHSYDHPDATSLNEAVSSVRNFISPYQDAWMPTTVATLPLLMGGPMDPASIPQLSSFVQTHLDHYDARCCGSPKGLNLLTRGAGSTPLNEAWNLCLTTAADTPGSLYRFVLTARASKAAVPRPLPPPRVPMPPRPPLPPEPRQPEEMVAGFCPEVRSLSAAAPLHAVHGDTLDFCWTHDAVRQHGRVARVPRRRHHSHDRSRSKPRRSPSPRPRHSSQRCGFARSNSGDPAGTRGQPVPASVALFAALRDAPDQVAWTFAHCKDIMTLAGIASTPQNEYTRLFERVKQDSPQKTAPLIHWMKRLLGTMSGEDPMPIHNMPRWFQNTIAGGSRFGLGA